MILEQIKGPEDLKKLTSEELSQLAEEIRAFLIEKISHTGGHLASNLGVVELTIALFRTFDLPEDKIIWDVGHQSYTHKILSGRRMEFDELRQYGGLSGFPKRKESPYDSFDTGHSSTSISAGLGIAQGRDILGEDYKVVSVIGDGALTGGMAYEALNNAARMKKNFIIILNDNKMSISENVGGMSRYLGGLRTGAGYNDLKKNVADTLERIPVVGGRMIDKIKRTKNSIKQLFIPGMLFENMGILYLGPVDGHNIPAMVKLFKEASKVEGPVLVHVITEKGKGYLPAERHPARFHGTEAFDVETGLPLVKRVKANYTDIFSTVMRKLGDRDEKVVAITAAMADGTGLKRFRNMFPERFFDVGIAEEHGLTFAGGLAAGGMRPVVALYATFLQRGLDCVFHDICLQNLPVIICADRAGIVEDGPTHHGIYDESFLLSMPRLSVLAPKNETELKAMLFAAYEQKTPVAIRYPRGASKINDLPVPALEWGKAEVVRDGSDLAIWAVGREVRTALEAAGILGCSCRIVNTRFLKPFDKELFLSDAAKMPIFTIEDNLEGAGLDSIADKLLINAGHHGVHHFAWPADKIIPHGTQSCLREKFGMTPKAIACKIRMILERN